jgi:undecaprenyl-diphosphatase
MLRRSFLAACLLAALCGAAPAAAPAADIALDPLKDGLILGGGIGLAGGSELLLRTRAPAAPATPDLAGVNAVDRSAIFSYSRTISIVSDITQYATVAIPLAIIATLEPRRMPGPGVVTLEAFSWAYGAKNTLKFLLPRDRPFMYGGGLPDGDPAENDQSFPSGHATMAFAAATAGALLFSTYYPGSPWLVPFLVADYAMAGLTASLRVLSGNHFVTDVLAGAALGMLCAYAIFALHPLP